MNFIKPYPKDTIVYRSAVSQDKLHGNWYSFSPNLTYGYGGITGSFKSVRDLRLIDITREDFYNEFINYINAYNLSNDQKRSILFPIGFRNFEVYKRTAQKFSLSPQPISDEIEFASQLFGNRSRCSTHAADTLFADFIKHIFKDHADGFIASIPLPNMIHNGMHHPELYIFDKADFKFVNNLPQTVTGGYSEHTNIVWPVSIDMDKLSPKDRETFEFMKDISKHLESGVIHKIKLFETVDIVETPKQNSFNTKNRKKTVRRRRRI